MLSLRTWIRANLDLSRLLALQAIFDLNGHKTPQMAESQKSRHNRNLLVYIILGIYLARGIKPAT